MAETLHEYEWDKGVRLKGSVLRFDTRRYNVMSFVSSARIEGSWRHTRAICTERTRTLLRTSHRPFQALVSPFGRRFSVGKLRLTLLPSGFMPGSAQILVESDSGTSLYVNNASLEERALAEPPQFTTADTLVIRAAYGRPDFVFPTWEDALDRIVTMAREVISCGEQPVFLCSPLGKAQEIVRCLLNEGINVTAHRSIARFNKAYRDMGFDPGVAHVFKGSPRYDQALVYPDHLRFSPAIRSLKGARLVWVSGLAKVPDALATMKVDDGIPLAGHLDYAGLLHVVEITRARRVFTVGGWAEEFADSLRNKGMDAMALYEDDQLTLI